MMGVYIKGMEMPTRCAECWLMDGEDSWCTACRGRHLYPEYRYGIKDRPEWCPLVPVPPHGRLIDADALKDVQQADADFFKGSSDYGEKCRYDEAINAVANIVNAPTIIPAEEKEENFCADCHWYEAEEQYCFRNGCHAYNESTCEHWEPMPADEPIPAPGGKTAPTTYDLLYEEGGPDTR